MTAIAPALSTALPPARARQLIASNAGLLAGTNQMRFTVPASAFAEAPGVPQARVIKDWKQAAGFSAMAIGELLQPIFDTVHLSAGRFGGGAGEAAWKPLLVTAIGEGIAGRGGLGLTDTVFRELIREHEAASSLQPSEPMRPPSQHLTKRGKI